MKFYIFSLALLCVIVFSTISKGHEINLNNGRTIQTETYWEDENFLYYEKYGATLKIPKSNIEKIDYSKAAEIKCKSNNEQAIAGIINTEELKAIEKKCKISCEDKYEQCAYRCLKNTDENNSANNCKSECRYRAKNCKWICRDEFMKNNQAFLKYEYLNSEKPLNEPYTMIGPTKSQLLEGDEGVIRACERKLKKSRKRGQQYWEDKVKSHGNKPARFLYNSDVYFREIRLLEAKKEYDLHKYGRRVSGREYHQYKRKLRSNKKE